MLDPLIACVGGASCLAAASALVRAAHAGATLTRLARDRTCATLRGAYLDVVAEGVPPHLAALIEKLDGDGPPKPQREMPS